MKGLLDPLNHQYLTLYLDLPHRISVEILKRNLTRSQRAGKSAEQSTARRRDQVIQGGGVRFLFAR